MTDYISNIAAPDGETRAIGGDNFDGQWVLSYYNQASNINLGAGATRTFDLSSYLPNDGKNYEILFGCSVNTPTTLNNTSMLAISPGSSMLFNIRLAWARVDVANRKQQDANNCIIPIDAQDKNITISNYEGNTTSGGIYVFLHGYRAIGGNE